VDSYCWELSRCFVFENTSQPATLHAPWGFAHDSDGKQVWETALESKYPRKMCTALVTLALDLASQRGLKLKATSLLDDQDPLKAAQFSQISVGGQPRASRIPPVVADTCSVAVFLTKSLTDIPCTLMSKLPHDIVSFTKEKQQVTVSQNSRFLRFSAISTPAKRGVQEAQKLPAKKMLEDTGS